MVPRRRKLHAFLPGIYGRLLFVLPGRPDDCDSSPFSAVPHCGTHELSPQSSPPVLTHFSPAFPTIALRAIVESSMTPKKNARKDCFWRAVSHSPFPDNFIKPLLFDLIKILRRCLAASKFPSSCAAPSKNSLWPGSTHKRFKEDNSA